MYLLLPDNLGGYVEGDLGVFISTTCLSCCPIQRVFIRVNELIFVPFAVTDKV